MGVKIAKKGVMVDRVVPARDAYASQESVTDVFRLVSLSTGPPPPERQRVPHRTT